MRRAGWLVLIAATLALRAPLNAAPAAVSAPADEYFGPFKYSPISIRTKIDVLGRSYASRWADDASIVHDAGLVESSLHAWVERYPHDPWAASAALHLAELYAQIQSASARAHALSAFRYVAQHFPSSPQGHLARLRLQRGLPPLHAESPVDPTPNPYASPSATPAATASEPSAPAPLATASFAATPSPAATASPSPR